MKKIPAERVELLNTGHVESRNLMEFLVLDPELILKNNFPDFNYIKGLLQDERIIEGIEQFWLIEDNLLSLGVVFN